MNELIFLVTWVGNIIGWWMAAWLLYRRWRPGGDHQLTHDISTSRYTVKIEPWSPGSVIIASMLVALLWPVVLAAVTIAIGQPPTDADLKAQMLAAEKLAAEKDKALDQAERELSIATTKMDQATGKTPVIITEVKNDMMRCICDDQLSKKVWHD